MESRRKKRGRFPEKLHNAAFTAKGTVLLHRERSLFPISLLCQLRVLRGLRRGGGEAQGGFASVPPEAVEAIARAQMDACAAALVAMAMSR